jgi:hypothetical protein
VCDNDALLAAYVSACGEGDAGTAARVANMCPSVMTRVFPADALVCVGGGGYLDILQWVVATHGAEDFVNDNCMALEHAAVVASNRGHTAFAVAVADLLSHFLPHSHRARSWEKLLHAAAQTRRWSTFLRILAASARWVGEDAVLRELGMVYMLEAGLLGSLDVEIEAASVLTMASVPLPVAMWATLYVWNANDRVEAAPFLLHNCAPEDTHRAKWASQLCESDAFSGTWYDSFWSLCKGGRLWVAQRMLNRTSARAGYMPTLRVSLEVIVHLFSKRDRIMLQWLVSVGEYAGRPEPWPQFLVEWLSWSAPRAAWLAACARARPNLPRLAWEFRKGQRRL